MNRKQTSFLYIFFIALAFPLVAHRPLENVQPDPSMQPDPRGAARQESAAKASREKSAVRRGHERSDKRVMGPVTRKESPQRRPSSTPSPVIIERPRPMIITTSIQPTAVLVTPVQHNYDDLMQRAHSISKKGRVVELLDGSLWNVPSKKDRRKAREWLSSDNIAFKKKSYILWSSYRLDNHTRGESIEISQTGSSLYEAKESHWIVESDPLKKEIILENGSVWRLANFTNEDSSLINSGFKDWNESDLVVLGLSQNNFGQCLFVLINTRTLKRSLSINIK